MFDILPTKDGKIDFEFMESFISELEEERISELSAYLTVSGLDNYELSSEEKEALELPTKNNEIDFSYMELLISAVQKLVIKDVVLWKDKKIEATKQVVGRN
ncbi:hypothetical protein JFL59_08835 [Histophilus somni]|uniref:hypothetical protein n=1 Tax=Histophilus somni TaxID=731 RepID=UPI0018EA3C10|nr:hypothetical protein [Histophilus somni]QQF70297.1 hypothetical protein JFL59_08835 [Histophilus somni]